MVICLERGTDLQMAQLMPLPLTISCFSKIQTGFTFLVPAHPGSPGQGPLNGGVCVCVKYYIWLPVTGTGGRGGAAEAGSAWRGAGAGATLDRSPQAGPGGPAAREGTG